jgi:hypothetical protein
MIGLTEQFVEELLQITYNLLISTHKLLKTLLTKRQLYLNFLQWLQRGSLSNQTLDFEREKAKNEEIDIL